MVAAAIGAAVAFLLALPWPPEPVAIGVGVPVLLLLIAIGYWSANAIGIPASRDRRGQSAALRSVAIGVALGAAVLLFLRFGLARLEPRILDRLARDAAVPLWRWAIILYHAPVLEEVVFRLFALSAIARLILAFRRRHDPPARAAACMLANLAAAILFAAAHLPGWYAAGPVSLALLISVVGLNAVPALVLGTIYVRHGLLAAILVHFGADVAVHLGGRFLI